MWATTGRGTVLATRRDIVWQRVRYVLGAVAVFAAGVVSAGITWR